MSRFNVRTDAHTKIVNGILFYPNVSVSVEEIIKRYGDPDFVTVSYDKLFEGSASFSDEKLYQDTSEIELGPFYKLWTGYGIYQPSIHHLTICDSVSLGLQNILL